MKLDPTLNPAQPEVIGTAALPPETKITAIAMPVDQVDLSYSQVVTLDDDVNAFADDYHLYVATRDGLRVLRSTDLSRPVSQWPPGSSILIRDMAAIGDYLYLATGNDGLKILNVAEATAPIEVSEIPSSLRQPAGQPPAAPLEEPTVGPEPIEESGGNQ